MATLVGWLVCCRLAGALNGHGDWVGLVVELADDVFEEILKGDHSHGCARGINNNGELSPLFAHDPHRARNRQALIAR